MKMDHPNIVKIFEFYISDKNYYLITEYCEGGSLFDLITKNKGNSSFIYYASNFFSC
jgi:serine/threonine protein kinase